jgi:hypothetical protein
MAVGDSRESFPKIPLLKVENGLFAERYIFCEEIVEIIIDS